MDALARRVKSRAKGAERNVKACEVDSVSFAATATPDNLLVAVVWRLYVATMATRRLQKQEHRTVGRILRAVVLRGHLIR